MSNVQFDNLVCHYKTFLPLPQTKLGLINKFLQAFSKVNFQVFDIIRGKFAKVTENKLKKGICIGLQFRELLNNFKF